MKYFTLICLALFVWNSANASDKNFYKQRYRGWFWFEERENKTKEIKPDIQVQKNLTPLEEIEERHKELEEKKALMIVAPSIENAKQYMEAQATLFKSADEVSKVWQAALLKYPHLNSLIDNPVNQHAISFKREINKEKDNNDISEFAKDYGLIFFFRADCKYCHEFAKVLAIFAKDFDISVEAISSGGGEIDGFVSRQDDYLTSKFNIQTYPTIIAYSPSHNKAFPVSHGYLSYDELHKQLAFTISLLKKSGKL